MGTLRSLATVNGIDASTSGRVSGGDYYPPPAAPTVLSAVVSPGGGSADVTFSEPVTGVQLGGLTLRADAVAKFWIIANPGPGYFTTWGGVIIGNVTPGQVCLLEYTPGTVQTADGRTLAAFSGFPVVNNA